MIVVVPPTPAPTVEIVVVKAPNITVPITSIASITPIAPTASITGVRTGEHRNYHRQGSDGEQPG